MARVLCAGIVACVMCTGVLATGGAPPQAGVYQDSSAPLPSTRVDQLVRAKLADNGIAPAALCSDAVFLRRAYLDVIGTLPTAQESRDFLLDKDSHKRAKLIDRLLQRPEFADYWAMKWDEVLRIKAEFPINLWPNAAQAYHHWVRDCLRRDLPLDQFAREMLTANGSNFRVPAVNFYRAVPGREPKVLARAVALTFMGERTDHWRADRLDGIAAFFSRVSYKPTGEWKEEIVFFDRRKAPSGLTVFPDGAPARLTPDQDPRQAFADWLLAADNPAFPRSVANRAWFWLLGRGIVHEPDDIRRDNPPSNPELLEYLQHELVAHHYDFKPLVRLILNSRTYQLSCVPVGVHSDAAAQFASYPLRRLDAEVFIDALDQVTGTSEQYSTNTPEPYTFIPDGTRTIDLPDGSITSAFLDMFGRPPRDTGMASERDNRPSARQRMFLLNSSQVRRKLEQCQWLQEIDISRGLTRDAVNQVYLTVLSRFSTDDEFHVITDYSHSGVARGREVLTDLTWALINSAEFAYRH